MRKFKTTLTGLTSLALVAIALFTLPAAPVAAQAVQPQRIAVYGASGRVGSRIVAEALARGHYVTGIGRNPDSIEAEDENLTVTRGDVTDAEEVARLVAGHDVVFSAVSGRDPAVVDPMLSLPMRAADSLVTAMRVLGEDAPRVMVIGGGSTTLDETLGIWFDDPDDIPEGPRGIQMLSHRLALEYLRRNDDGMGSTRSSNLGSPMYISTISSTFS